MPPEIACSATVTVAIMGVSAPVSFPAPTITNGQPPVSYACTPASGSAFSLGTTAVSCVATDSASRQSACQFNVVANGIQLGAKRFSSVGDSLTEGENGLPQGIITPAFTDTPNSYPVKLQALFDTNFPNQNIVVFSHGFGGDKAAKTLERLPAFLNSDRPEAVLILSGYNDIAVPCSAGYTDNTACDDAINVMQSNLREIIRTAKNFSGVRYVFVSTLTPGRPGSRMIDSARIIDANNHIIQAVAAEGTTLVDTYQEFLGHESTYVSTDGLHLLPPGYQAMAQTFYNKILTIVPRTTPQSFR